MSFVEGSVTRLPCRRHLSIEQPDPPKIGKLFMTKPGASIDSRFGRSNRAGLLFFLGLFRLREFENNQFGGAFADIFDRHDIAGLPENVAGRINSRFIAFDDF